MVLSVSPVKVPILSSRNNEAVLKYLEWSESGERKPGKKQRTDHGGPEDCEGLWVAL
jgi:hypothetical protein